MELGAQLRFEIRRKMYFLMQFMISVGKRTFVLEFAFSEKFKVSTHFSLVLYLVLVYEILSFCLWVKMLPWFLHSCLLKLLVDKISGRILLMTILMNRFVKSTLLIVFFYGCGCVRIIIDLIPIDAWTSFLWFMNIRNRQSALLLCMTLIMRDLLFSGILLILAKTYFSYKSLFLLLA